eukprot:3582129-Ditylum_brightwellii.AAC.1
MRERQKRIDMMAREVMCCYLGRDNLSGGHSAWKIERHTGLKINMMIQRDTESRDDDDDDGLTKEADEKSKQAA